MQHFHDQHALLAAAWRRRSTLGRLAGMLDAGWWTWTASVTLLVTKLLPVFFAPLYFAYVIARLGEGAGGLDARFWWITAGFATILVGNIPANAALYAILCRAIRRMERRLRGSLMARLQQLSMGYHSHSQSGALQAKVLRDVENVVGTSQMLFMQGLATILSIVWVLAVTLYREPLVCLGFIIAAPLAAGVYVLFHRAIRQRNRALRQRVERMSARVVSMLDMLPVTRAHALEEKEVASLDLHLAEVEDRAYRVDTIGAWFAACGWVLLQTSLLAVLVLTAVACSRGFLTLDDVVLYYSLFGMIVMNIVTLLNFAPQCATGFEALASLGEVLECPDLERNTGRQQVNSVAGAISLEQVSFSYQSPDGTRVQALQDFSLSVAAGECIAVVGESGSGKSTLMSLLIGFHRPESGRILYDGIAQDELDLRSWRRFLSVVPQQTVLFAGSLRDNILYGCDEVSEARLQDILAAAHLQEVIDILPQGLDTPVGENGAKLSGGQRQRIAIARALIRDPRVIILDEATSALDVCSERAVQAAIDNLIRNRTTFIVAHRLSTIRGANRIAVLHHGRLVECAAEGELLKQAGTYSRLKALQI